MTFGAVPADADFAYRKDKADGKGGESRARELGAELAEKMNLGGTGVSTMATATKLGDFFQYAIDKPVTLPRQKSALLPIVNKDVEGTRRSPSTTKAPRPSSRSWASSSRTPPACT